MNFYLFANKDYYYYYYKNEILWKLYQVIFIPYSAQLNQWLSCVLLRWNGNPILPDGLIYEGVSETPLKVSVVHTAQ